MTDSSGNPNNNQPVADQILNAISGADRAANVDVGRAANQANAVTGIYGNSGTGKSMLSDTAIEYAWETYGAISLVYAADLGGFGNKRLSLIRAGIARVWDPQNHVNPFETMELMSLGAWPAKILDPERGFADPNVPLLLPRRVIWLAKCPQGHVAGRFDDQQKMVTSNVVCPTCKVLTTVANMTTEQMIVKHRMFDRVGMRVYDSFTALNDWGMNDLQHQSAVGSLPASSTGGSLLGAADALVSGRFRFGSSSEGQYGFLQNRTYSWLRNIRTIPDQVMPAIATFHVSMSKEAKGKAGGGDLLYGPKIAGDARTATIPGWLGNLIHTATEPYSDVDPTLVFRAWISNHIDPRDERKIPYVAKHRGHPIGMPRYLEDPPGAEPFSGFSLKVFFSKLQDQLATLQAETKTKYPDAPGIFVDDDQAAGGAAGGPVQETVIAAPVATLTPAVGAVASAAVEGQVTGRRRRGSAGTGAGAGVTALAAPVAPAPAAATASATPVTQSPTAPAASGAGPVPPATGENTAAPSVIAQQLTATLAAAGVEPAVTAATTSSGNGGGGSPIPPGGGPISEHASGNVAAGSTAAVVGLPDVPATVPTPPPSSPAAQSIAQPIVPSTTQQPGIAPAPTRLRRVARPPV